jgi:hypothetical protein
MLRLPSRFCTPTAIPLSQSPNMRVLLDIFEIVCILEL